MKLSVINLSLFSLMTLFPLISDGQALFEYSTKEKATFIDESRVYIKPDFQQFINYNYTELGSFLKNAPDEADYNSGKPGLKLSLPNPDGSYTIFDVYESIIMEPELYE